MQKKREISDIRLFGCFTQALASVQTGDLEILSWPRPRAAFCFRLALYLQQAMPALRVDLQPCLSSRGPDCDIVLRTAEGQVALQIWCKPDYFSAAEQTRLQKAASDSHSLVLALSFFPKRDYFLIYRARERMVEYYHFDRQSLSCSPLKNRDVSDGSDPSQLTLRLRTK